MRVACTAICRTWLVETVGPFDELLTLYTLEGFLTRLAGSAHSTTLVLKGGLLLAAYDTRRPTRDADFAGQRLTNQVEGITTLVRDIAAIRVEDGLRFDADSARGETIREEDLYSGVRVHLSCRLASALTHLKVDVNVGDPITPAPQHVHVPRLLDQGDTIDLVGYPLPMVHAEKIVTAIQRGVVNTRWRDFADIYLLCHHQPVDAAALREALGAVAGHRGTELQPLTTVLAGYADAPSCKANGPPGGVGNNFTTGCPSPSATSSRGSAPSPTRSSPGRRKQQHGARTASPGPRGPTLLAAIIDRARHRGAGKPECRHSAGEEGQRIDSAVAHHSRLPK